VAAAGHSLPQAAASWWRKEDPESNEAPGRRGGRSQVDYKEILSSSEFTVFSELRRIRKEISQTEAVPAYAIFTNEQLAQASGFTDRPVGLTNSSGCHINQLLFSLLNCLRCDDVHGSVSSARTGGLVGVGGF
jgi:hypothetical protein